MITKIKKLNNKSRKGLYVYVSEKNKPPRYYKIDNISDNLKPYTLYYKKKYVDENKDSPKLKEIKKYYDNQKPEAILKRKYGKRTMTSIFQKGIGITKINNAHGTDIITINDKNKELLKNIVKDKETLNIVIQEENMIKLKHRFNHTIIFYDENNKEMAKDVLIGKHTLLEIVQKIKNNIMQGEYIDKTRQWKIINEKLGTQIKNAKTGEINRIEIVSTFTVNKKR